MAYTDKKMTPLKWHRFRQILIMPVTILALLYTIACFVIDYFRIKTPEFFNIVTRVLEKLDIDMHMEGGLQTWIFIGMGCLVLVFLLELIQWLKSFRWKTGSLVCEILLILLFTAGSVFAAYALIGLGFAADASDLLSAALHKRIEPVFVQVIAGIVFGIIVLYNILMIFYYIKRRKLYGRKKDEEDDIPFIDEEKPSRRKKKSDKDTVVVPDTPEVKPVEPVVTNVPKSDDLVAEGPEKAIDQTAAVLGLKFCTNCGTRLSKEDLSMTYCKYCGKKFEKK